MRLAKGFPEIHFLDICMYNVLIEFSNNFAYKTFFNTEHLMCWLNLQIISPTQHFLTLLMYCCLLRPFLASLRANFDPPGAKLFPRGDRQYIESVYPWGWTKGWTYPSGTNFIPGGQVHP
jgi:hypothetical protein